MKIDREKMSEASKLVATILDKLHDFIRPQLSTEDLDAYCGQLITESGGRSGAKGYKGFPKNVCISVNDKVCHGVASPHEILKNGDIVSVDIVINYNGFFGDSCFTYAVGTINPIKQKIIDAAYESMWNAISCIQEGLQVNLLGRKMEETALQRGFKTVRDFCGHGIGRVMHQNPSVPFFFDREANDLLVAGEFITIEPMVVEKSYKLCLADDGWTAFTEDGGQSAQFEHTVEVLKNGYNVVSFNNFDKNQKKNQTLSSDF